MLILFCIFALNKCLNVNYQVFLKQANVKIRKGPNSKSPITCVLTHRFYPLRVTGVYDHWVRVIDHQGELGWVHKSYVSTKFQYGVVLKKTLVYKDPIASKTPAAVLPEHCLIKICKIKDQWYQISFHHKNKAYQGWVKDSTVWT